VKQKFLYGVIMASATLAGTMMNASADTLDIKPGLWETTARTQAHGQLPISEAELNNLSPQQRAAIAKMQARANQPHTRVVKGCITKQDLEEGEADFLSGKSDMKCESKFSKRTRSSVAGTRRCSRPGMQQTTEFAFTAQDREHVTGKLSITISNGARTMSSSGDLTSHWISASCGKTS
jgi:Protein of unknown function (DUF3617)